jgi:hypothetical protein
MYEVTHGEAIKSPGERIRLFQPWGAGGNRIAPEGFYYGTIKESSWPYILPIVWDEESANKWGSKEDGLGCSHAWRHRSCSYGCTTNRRYWILTKHKRLNTIKVIDNSVASKCLHQKTKSIPLGLGGNCEIITVCCVCKEEVL